MGAKFTLLTVFFLLLQQTWTADPIPDVNFINDAIPNIWTDWSDWSECSRSCDGGISHQRRACRISHCEGSAFKYKICNMQPCPDSSDFREKQCTDFNEIPYKGDQMTWKAYYHPQEPCSLHCVNQYNDVELLAPKVHDGTRCRPGSLDMCIDGKCMPVGCDLEIGSTKTVDNCGVCGGNGKTCSLPLYQWNENTNTTCSLKCGGGYKITQPVCQNTATGDIVDQHLCDISQMPEGRLLECNVEPCPPKWEAGEWSVCSQSCGSGIKTRRLYCVEEHNKTKTKVFNHLCKGHKPRMQESCNMQPCPPEWITGQWSKCSATCGQGIQTRSVTCNKNPADMMQCDPLKKPSTEQKCFADTSCQEEKYYSLYDDGPKSSAVSYKDTEYRAEKLIAKQNGSPHAVFVTEEWGPCSVTCGEGFRKRKVYCKAHLDYMNVMTKFADDTCGGDKPVEIERCVNKPCTSDTIWDASVQDGYGEDLREDSLSPKVAPGAYGKTYSWVKNGFTPCTATCLGGVQELIVNCIRDDDKKVVSPYLCDTKTQPAVITQTCNDHPCPPRWNVSEFTPCNKKCGMGLQTREVNCIHEVTMSNTVAVPHNMCEQPAPPDRQHCNIVDCSVEWYTSNWTKCSKVCGGGIKTRTVECRQITAQDRIVSHPDQMCEGRKPQTTAPCNGRPCGKNKKPGSHVISSADNQAYVQVNANKVASVKIGGRATVFQGSSMRIKCPTKNFAKEQIVWEKDGKEIHNDGNYRVLKKRGILKIETLSYSDNATFTCKAGSSSSNLIVHVRPPPGKLPASSEESAKHNNQLDPAIPMEISGKANFELSEDISHERLSEYEKNQRKYTQKKPTTPKFLPPVGATTNEMVANQGTKHQMVDSLLPSGSSTSSGSRLTPYFFGILINLKRFWSFQHSENIRSQRMLMEEPVFDEVKHTVIAEQTTTENMFGTTMILGKGERDNVKFEWFITSWSNCSPPCGGTGFQIRAAHCMVKVNNITQNVESNLCEDAGLPTPITIQKCDTNECPHWITKDWQDCNSSRCFAWNTAMQKRDVFCQLANGTLVPDALCEASEKPITKQECYNDLCKGTWKVGDWTECYASCDKEGVKYRILQCVWYGTKKPAGTACRDLPRPAVMRTCRGISCAEVYLQRTSAKTRVNIVRM